MAAFGDFIQRLVVSELRGEADAESLDGLGRPSYGSIALLCPNYAPKKGIYAMNLLKQLMAYGAILWLFAAAALPATATDEPPYTRTRDVIYGRKAGLALTMDGFRPRGKENGAAILWLASGDYMSDMERFEPSRLELDFLRSGYTVFVIGHSSFPVFPLDEIVHDVHRAVRYVRQHAQEYRVDADRLAMIGISSGGHLAAHVGVSGGKGPPFPTPDITGVGRYDPIEREAGLTSKANKNVCPTSKGKQE